MLQGEKKVQWKAETVRARRFDNTDSNCCTCRSNSSRSNSRMNSAWTEPRARAHAQPSTCVLRTRTVATARTVATVESARFCSSPCRRLAPLGLGCRERLSFCSWAVVAGRFRYRAGDRGLRNGLDVVRGRGRSGSLWGTPHGTHYGI